MPQFNDTTNEQGLVQHLRYLTGQDSMPVNTATRLINYALDDYAYLALTSDGTWKFDDSNSTDLPIVTTTVVSGQNDYALNTSFLMIDRVEFNDGGGWVILDSIDRKDFSAPLSELYTTDAQVTSQGASISFDHDGNSIFLYPTPSSGTLKVYLSRAPEQFVSADTTKVAGIPRIHQEYLVLHAAHRASLAQNDSDRVSFRNELQIMEGKIRDFYDKRTETRPRVLKTKTRVIK